MGFHNRGDGKESAGWGASEDDKYVKYGDFVALSGAAAGQGGFAGADPVLSDTLFFEKVKENREHDIPDVQACIFTILPKFMYSASKAAKKKMRESDSAIRETEKEELEAALRSMEDEKDTNDMELKRRAGKAVEYGAVVQLQHSISRKFVTQLKNRAEVDTLAMEVGLQLEGEEASWWRIRSKETTRRNGEGVKWDDAVIFENVKFTHSYISLTRSPEGEGVGTWAQGICGTSNKTWEVQKKCEKGCKDEWTYVKSSYNEAAMADAKKLKYINREEVCAGAKPFRFRVMPFLPLKEQDVALKRAVVDENYSKSYTSLPHRLLHGGVVLKLIHRRTGHLLHANASGDVNWVHTEYREGEVAERGAYSSNQEAAKLHATDEKDRTDPGCFWRVIGVNVRMGGMPIGHGDILIQHLVTGSYLGVEEEGLLKLGDAPDGEMNHWEVITQFEGENGEPCCNEPVRGGDVAWMKSKGGSKLDLPAASMSSLSAPRSAGAGRSVDQMLRLLHHQGSMKRGASSKLLTPMSRDSPQQQQATTAWLGCDSPDLAQERSAVVYPALLRSSHHPINDDVLELQIVDFDEAVTVDDMRHRHELLKALYNSLKQIPPVPEDFADKVEEQVAYIKKNAQKVLTPQLTRLFETNMKRMIFACRAGDAKDVFNLTGAAVPEVQDLLLSTGVLKLCIELVQVLTETVKVPPGLIKPRLPRIFTVVRMSYLLVQQACMDNVRCKKAMFPYFKLMQSQVSAMIGSYYAMMETLRGFRDILIDLPVERIKGGVGYLRQSGNAKLLAFLIEACRCGKEPLRRNQNMIIDEIFANKDTLFKMTFEGDDVIVTRPLVDGGQKLSVLHCLENNPEVLNDPNLKMKETEDPELKAFMYYLYMLHLFVALLDGRNEHAHKQLLESSERMGFGYQDLLQLLRNAKLPDSLRQVACSLITQLYVDCEPYEHVRVLKKTRVWGGLWPEPCPPPTAPNGGSANAGGGDGGDGRGGGRRGGPALRSAASNVSAWTADTGNSSPIRRDAFASMTSMTWDAEDEALEEGWEITRELSRKPSERQRRTSVEEVIVQLEEGRQTAISALCSLSKAQVETRANYHRCPELKQLLIVFLEENTVTNHDNVGRNELVYSLVELIVRMGKFGFFTKEDPDCRQELLTDFSQVRPLTEALIKVLDGRKDTCTPESRFRRSSNGGVGLSRLASQGNEGVSSTGARGKGSIGSSPHGQSFRTPRLRRSTPSAVSTSSDRELDTARFRGCPRSMVVFRLKRLILEYIIECQSAAEDRRVSIFVRTWHRLLKNRVEFRLDKHEQNPPLGAKANGKSPSEHGARNGPKGREGRNMSKREQGGKQGEDAKAPTNESLSFAEEKKIANGLWTGTSMEAYTEDENLWEKDPIWTEADIREMCKQMFEHEVLVADVVESPTLQEMFQPGSTCLLPTWTCILLDLVRYDCPYVKQRSIALLVTAFNVQPSFVSTALSTHILYCPTVAVDYLRAVQNKQTLLRMQRLFNSEESEEREKAYKDVAEIYREWGSQTQLSPDRHWMQVKEWQQVMSTLGGIDFALYMLGHPFDRIRTIQPGTQDKCKDPLVQEMFQAIYFFLYWQCMDNDKTQKLLLQRAELIHSHLGLEGVGADKLLGGICKNNMDIVERVGKDWIRMLFFDLVNRYKCARIEWLQILHYLMKCRGNPLKSNQALVMTYFQQCEDILASFMTTDEDHDRRIQLMVEVKDHCECDRLAGLQEESKLGYHLAVVRLLAVCSEGKNPAAEVYAAHFVSLASTMRSLLALNRRPKTGEEVQVPKGVYYRVKATYINLLLHVFVDTKVRRLIIELEREGNGLWSCDEEGIIGCKPLMEQIADELQLLADGPDAVAKREGGCVKAWWDALLLYKRTSVVPLLQYYYSMHYARVRGSPDVGAVANCPMEIATNRIYDALSAIYERDQALLCEQEAKEEFTTPCCMTARQAHEQVRKLLQTIEKHCNIKNRSGETYKALTTTTSRGSTSVEEEAMKVMHAIKHGYRALVGAVAKQYGAEVSADGGGMGVRKAALLLCRQGEVPLYNCPGLFEDGRRVPAPPQYEDFGRAILDVSHFKDTNSSVVCNILQLMSASIYILDPTNPHKTPQDCDQEWKDMTAFAPARKQGKYAAETLEWVQNKYDEMGCTVAALRLMHHQDSEVQMRAVGLLLTLLQKGNRRVQRSVVRYIASTQDRGILHLISATLESALDNLGDLKRKTKAAKSAGHIVAEEDSVMSNIQGFARESRLMLILRLVQLLCEGQFRGLQDLIREPDDQGKTVMGRMVDLLEVIPPLLPDALLFRDGSFYILGMQIADALSEAVQGPNQQSQDFLMGGNFLVVANRMFSLLHYVPFEGDQCKARQLGERGDGVYMNDCICWLKLSLLRCCAALLEGCVDGRQADTMMQFVELRNIQAQLVQTSTILGIVSNKRDAGDSASGTITDSVSTSSMDRKRARRSGACRRKGLSKCLDAYHFSADSEHSLEDEMYTCWFLLLTLAEFDQSGAVHETLHQIHLDHAKLARHLQDATCDVELVRARKDLRGDKVVERVFFRVSDKVRELVQNGRHFREKATEKMFDVPRENPQEKARLFVGRLRLVHTRVKYYVVLLNCSFREWVIMHQNWIDAAPRILSVIITVLLLLLYGIPYDPNSKTILGDGRFFSSEDEIPAGYQDDSYAFANATSDPEGIGMLYSTIVGSSDPSLKFRLKLESRWKSLEEWQAFPEARPVLGALAILHVVLTLANVSVYIMFELPLLISEILDQHQKYIVALDQNTRGRHGRGAAQGDDGEEESYGLNEALSQIESEDYLQRGDEEIGDPPTGPRRGEWRLFFWKTLCRMHMCCYLAVMCTLSVLGAVSSPFFFVFYMLDYFRTRDGRMVVQAVILGGPNLARSFIVGMIVIICFGFYSYAYFSDSVNHEQEVCRSPFQCVTKHILDSMTGDLTTVLGDDFGNYAFPALVLWSDSWQGWRTAFLFVSIVFWVFLLQGIIQGQIIDAFAEKRATKLAKKQDLESKCFVTSIDRFVFSAYPGEWEKRRGGEFAWNYLLFLAYLEDKDPEEYSGLENEVSRALKRDSVAFLPVETFVAQQRELVKQGRQDDVEAKIDSFSSRLSRIEGALDRLSLGSHAVAAHVHGMSDHVASIGANGTSARSYPVPATPVQIASRPEPAAAYLMGSPQRQFSSLGESRRQYSGLGDQSPPIEPIEPIASMASPLASPRDR